MRKLGFFLLTILINTVLTFVIITFAVEWRDPPFVIDNTITKIEKEFLVLPIPEVTRLEVNNIIQSNPEIFYSFYATMSGNTEASELILQKCLDKEVPINLMFALVKIESNFREKAYNVNYNGSTDRGYFQLNSNSYPHYSKEELYDPIINVNLGVSHYKGEYQKYGSYEMALIGYNAGNISRPNKTAVEYMGKVLKEEARINDDFNDFYKDMFIDGQVNRSTDSS